MNGQSSGPGLVCSSVLRSPSRGEAGSFCVPGRILWTARRRGCEAAANRPRALEREEAGRAARSTRRGVTAASTTSKGGSREMASSSRVAKQKPRVGDPGALSWDRPTAYRGRGGVGRGGKKWGRRTGPAGIKIHLEFSEPWPSKTPGASQAVSRWAMKRVHGPGCCRLTSQEAGRRWTVIGGFFRFCHRDLPFGRPQARYQQPAAARRTG